MDKKHLTKKGYDKIVTELKDRKVNVRRKIAELIETARRMGDLSENAAYKSALEDRTLNEKRIREIENIISKAVIIEKVSTGKIELGSVVTIESDGDECTYTIVGATEADPGNLYISNESPIGAALFGKKAGDIIKINLPAGTREFAIIKIE